MIYKMVVDGVCQIVSDHGCYIYIHDGGWYCICMVCKMVDAVDANMYAM
jgi:hypothetical protein